MKNLNLNNKVSLMNSIDEFLLNHFNSKIFRLNLVYYRGTFFVEKSTYLDVPDNQELSFNQVFYLKEPEFDLEKMVLLVFL